MSLFYETDRERERDAHENTRSGRWWWYRVFIFLVLWKEWDRLAFFAQQKRRAVENHPQFPVLYSSATITKETVVKDDDDDDDDNVFQWKKTAKKGRKKNGMNQTVSAVAFFPVLIFFLPLSSKVSRLFFLLFVFAHCLYMQLCIWDVLKNWEKPVNITHS